MAAPRGKIPHKNPPTLMDVGIQLLTIISITYARNSSGDMITSDSGDPAIDIKFINPLKQELIHRFWITENTAWILDNLRKAIGVYKEDHQTPVNELLGKNFFGIIAAQFFFSGIEIDRDNDGNLIYAKELQMKFFPNVTGIRPAIMGDPSRRKGIPSGDFLVNKGIVVEDYLNDQDKAYLLQEMGTPPPSSMEILHENNRLALAAKNSDKRSTVAIVENVIEKYKKEMNDEF